MGWSQKALADRAGVSQRTISNLEDENAHSPKLVSLSQVCRALGIEPFSALLEGASSTPETSAVLGQLVEAFLACGPEGQKHIAQTALREATFAQAESQNLDGTSPLPRRNHQ